ncbi:RDD family protein [Planctomyces sp. SH-PL62]|uniref:RDD family protein n=1 Tax=Planctomyces sp. SH-PL62 TaxID=1636152 RepID=UPI00078C8E21|nr:RDD family protein [Planctomyces sp. SH-PL62]AMV38233.1 RDD family protein [Planctomyces sp. SH-PL62]
MSQAVEQPVQKAEIDPYEIGWYIESADEETYGPVSRDTLSRWILDATITPNTLVRHCTQPEAKPLADQPGLRDRLPLDQVKAGVGDRLEGAWPRKSRERLALAEGSAPCARHNRPATLVCVRCHAPYCDKCRMKPFKRAYFLCRRCQSSHYNRRAGALILDTVLLVYIPIFAIALGVAAIGMEPDRAALFINLASLLLFVLILLRDSLFGGASPGKRAVGLRVVRSADGVSPLTNGQGVVRWLSQFIPFFNLYDVLVPYRDPLFRRIGDRWAKTRVLDSPSKLAKVRADVARRLLKKGVQPPREVGTTMEDLARLA